MQLSVVRHFLRADLLLAISHSRYIKRTAHIGARQRDRDSGEIRRAGKTPLRSRDYADFAVCSIT